MAATFGNVWTLKTVAYGDSIKPWTDSRWMNTDELLGCPRKLCFDGRIDAAYGNTEEVYFLAGKYIFTHKGFELSNGKRAPFPDDELNTESITAAAILTDTVSNEPKPIWITSTGRVIFHFVLIPLRSHQLFKDMNESTSIDAAIGQGNQLTLIVGRHHSVYTYERENFHLNTSYELNTNRWSPIFRHIDAAYSNGSFITLISGNFFMTSNTTDNTSQLIQRNLFNCPDDVYKVPIIGINGFDGFVKYEEQFRPIQEFRPIITTPQTGPSKATIAIIVLTVVLLVVLILFLFIYLCKKTDQADQTNTISIMNQDTTVANSQDPTSVTIDSSSNIGSEIPNLDDHLSRQNATPAPTTVKSNTTFNSMQPMTVQSDHSNTSVTVQSVKH